MEVSLMIVMVMVMVMAVVIVYSREEKEHGACEKQHCAGKKQNDTLYPRTATTNCFIEGIFKILSFSIFLN